MSSETHELLLYCGVTYEVKGFGPGVDVACAVQALQQSVAQHIDHHGQRVHCSTVERQGVTKALRRGRAREGWGVESKREIIIQTMEKTFVIPIK